MRVTVSLGSNLDDRLALLRAARDLLFSLHEGDEPFLVSRIYETAPMDCPPGSPPFLNAAVELSSNLPPFDFLAITQRWESELGRPADHAFHAPRTIDIDLLFYGTLQISHPLLTLPHPRISERQFVLTPLTDICPDRFIFPQNKPIRTLCEARKDLAIKFLTYF
jgi:2-amino-4-hydroxy-6-hydroxymethyldihydropteridine diphosphokinase